MMRIIALVALVSLFSTHTQAAALICAPAPSILREDAAFNEILDAYIQAYQNSESHLSLHYTAEILRRVFAKNNSDYEAQIQELDAQSARYPDAISVLAGRLQLAWERDHPTEALESERAWTRLNGSQSAVIALGGIAGLTLLSIRNPKLAPGLFRWIKEVRLTLTFLPVVTAGALQTLEGLQGVVQRSSLSPSLKAPADLMNLGLTENSNPHHLTRALKNEALLRNVLANSAATLVAIGTVELSAMRVAGTLMRVSPPLFIAGAVASYGAEQFVGRTIDLLQAAPYKKKILSAREQILLAQQCGDSWALHRFSNELLQATRSLALLNNQTLALAERDALGAITQAQENYGSGSIGLYEAIAESNRLLNDAAQRAIENRGPFPVLPTDPDLLALWDQEQSHRFFTELLPEDPSILKLRVAAFLKSVDHPSLKIQAQELATEALIERAFLLRASAQKSYHFSDFEKEGRNQ